MNPVSTYRNIKKVGQAYKNAMGVNAKTPVAPAPKSNTLPKNMVQPKSGGGSWGSNNASPTLQQLSKDMATINKPASPKWKEGHAKNSGAAEIATVTGNVLNNVASVTGKARDYVTGSNPNTTKTPQWKNMFEGIYGPNKEEIAKSEASARVADAKLKARGATTASTKPTATTPTRSATSSTVSSPTQSTAPSANTQNATSSNVSPLTTLPQIATKPKLNERGGLDKTSGRDTGQKNSYWKDSLDSIKGAANSNDTPANVQPAMDRVTALQQQMTDLEKDYGMRSAGANTKGRDLAVKSGRGRELQANYQAEKNALAQQLNQANTQLQQEVSMYGTRAGLMQGLASQTAPQMQFGQITDPLTGQPMSGGMYGSNPQLQNAVQQAYQIYKSNGGDINDPQIQRLLSTFEMPAQSLITQFAQMGNSGQMPNFQGQSSSVGTRNAMIQQLGPEAIALDSALQSIGRLEPIMSDFMQKSGISPTDNSTLNQLSQQYRGSWGDQATTQYNTMLGELQKFSAAVLGSGASLTPTMQGQLAEMQNPGNLSLPRIQQYLREIHNLGQNNLNVQLGQIQNMGGTGYFGNQAPYTNTSTFSNNTSTGNTAFGGNIQNPYAQAGAGVLPYLATGVGAAYAAVRNFFR